MSNRHRRSHLNHSTTWPGSGACQKVVIRRFSYQEFISDIALKLFRQQRKHKYEMEKKKQKLLFHFKSFKCVAHAQRAQQQQQSRSRSLGTQKKMFSIYKSF